MPHVRTCQGRVLLLIKGEGKLLSKNRSKYKAWDLNKLKTKETKTSYACESDRIAKEIDTRGTWEKVNEIIMKTAEKSIGYLKLKNRITQKCREAIEKWMDGVCQDIQYNLSSCNIGRAHNIIKKLSKNPKPKSTVVKNKD